MFRSNVFMNRRKQFTRMLIYMCDKIAYKQTVTFVSIVLINFALGQFMKLIESEHLNKASKKSLIYSSSGKREFTSCDHLPENYTPTNV